MAVYCFGLFVEDQDSLINHIKKKLDSNFNVKSVQEGEALEVQNNSILKNRTVLTLQNKMLVANTKINIINILLTVLCFCILILPIYLITGLLLSNFNILYLLPSIAILICILLITRKYLTNKYFRTTDIKTTNITDILFIKDILNLKKYIQTAIKSYQEVNETNILLETKNLNAVYELPDSIVYAVNDVSFVLDKGESMALVGESGCGKSAAAMSVVRLLPQPEGYITSGDVLYRNTNITKMNEKEIEYIRGDEIAFIFQDPMTSLNPYRRIGEQIIDSLVYHLCMDIKQSKKRALELLNAVKLPDAEKIYNSYPHELSGGMRQRVMIAIAVSCEPSVIIADEPTTDLDVTTQKEIMDLIEELQKTKKISLLLISHDIALVYQVCDKIAVMYAGYIVEYGRACDVVEMPSHPYTKLLLKSVPTIDSDIDRLAVIKGSPPDLSKLPKGCPFKDRCDYHIDKCGSEMPEVREHSGRKIRCWVDINV